MSHQTQDRVIALSAICQAAQLVQDIARENNADSQAFACSIKSLLMMNADQTIDIFGSVDHLQKGLKTCSLQLGDQPQARNVEITRYLVGILTLERRLNKDPQVLQELASRLKKVDRQLDHFELVDPQVIANLAQIYSDLISPLGPKINVGGNVTYLQQSSNQDKVRALLLAGIRAAVLWRQVGGRRRQMIFSRSKYNKEIQQLLNSI